MKSRPNISHELEKLPMPALLAMAMTSFIFILTETLPAGLLPEISAGLGISQSLAGQLVTVYAVGTVVAAIPITALTQSWRRKTTLLTAVISLFVFNTVTALSSDYSLTLICRFLAGVATGMAWAILGGYARRMVVDRLKGRALAIAMVGTPVALSVGVPLATFLGSLIGWRAVFLCSSGLTLLLIGWVVISIPDFPGTATDNRTSLKDVFLAPGIRPILATIFAWMCAHNILYSYIAPFADHVGLGARVDLLLFAFGLAALVGIWITGALVDRILRVLVLASLASFGLVAIFLGTLGNIETITVLGMLVWGLSFGGAATQLQTAAADAAGKAADLATAMIATTWNIAIAMGGIVGGVALEHWGAGAFPWTMLPLIVAAGLIVAIARRNAFKPGPRAVA